MNEELGSTDIPDRHCLARRGAPGTHGTPQGIRAHTLPSPVMESDLKTSPHTHTGLNHYAGQRKRTPGCRSTTLAEQRLLLRGSQSVEDRSNNRKKKSSGDDPANPIPGTRREKTTPLMGRDAGIPQGHRSPPCRSRAVGNARVPGGTWPAQEGEVYVYRGVWRSHQEAAAIATGRNASRPHSRVH